MGEREGIGIANTKVLVIALFVLGEGLGTISPLVLLIPLERELVRRR